VSTGQVIVTESVKTKGGVDKVLEEGVQSISRNIQSRLFPAESKSVNKRNGKVLRNAFIFGGGGAVLIGGGIVAYLYFTGSDPQSESINTRIVLP
jgi:hypothetical protein